MTLFGFLMSWGIFWLLLWMTGCVVFWHDMDKPRGSAELGASITGAVISVIYLLAVFVGHML